MILYVISVGLSVTMGLMGFINLAHGAFAMAGGFILSTAMARWGMPFPVALVIALVVVAVISASGDGNQTRTSGIPDVVGMAEADAVALLEDAGFDVHSLSLPRDGVPEGIVASQG